MANIETIRRLLKENEEIIEALRALHPDEDTLGAAEMRYESVRDQLELLELELSTTSHPISKSC